MDKSASYEAKRKALESAIGQLDKKFGKGAYITKATAQLMRDFGSIQSPQHAFYINLGLESLHVRMKRHCENAQKVAEFLNSSDKIEWVRYCGLKGDKYYELGQKYLPNGGCGVIAFGLKGTREDAIQFMDNLKLACIVTHVADARTCVLHPASHTHRQLTDEQLRGAGVAPDRIRLSVGIEDAEDIIADIEHQIFCPLFDNIFNGRNGFGTAVGIEILNNNVAYIPFQQLSGSHRGLNHTAHNGKGNFLFSPLNR